MNWEFLLEKDDLQKLQLLTFLERQPNQKVRIKEIQEALDCSYYLVRNSIFEIEKDIDNLYLSDYFMIEITDTDIAFHEKMNTNTTLFLQHYLRESIQVKILTELFFKENFSISQFAEDHFSSYAFVYKRYLHLKQSLKHLGIEIDRRNHLVGEEHSIWLFFCHLFQTIYPIEEISNPQQLMLIRQTVEKIQPVLKKILSETVKANLYHLLLIFLTRHKRGYSLHYSRKNKQLLLKIQQNDPELFTCLTQEISMNFGFSKNEIGNELLFLSNFLYGEGLTEPIKKDFPEAGTELITNFVEEFEQVFSMKLSEAERIDLRRALEILVWDVFYFPIRSRFFVDSIEITYFKNSYPEYFEFCQRIIARANLVVSTTAQKRFLFYYGLLALIRFVPISRVSDSIEVCIDFSIGENYNNLIQRDLLYFSSLNVKVVNIQSEKTRMILTDSLNLSNQYSAKKIIWLTPPRPEDWEQVVDELIMMRHEDSSKYLHKDTKKRDSL